MSLILISLVLAIDDIIKFLLNSKESTSFNYYWQKKTIFRGHLYMYYKNKKHINTILFYLHDDSTDIISTKCIGRRDSTFHTFFQIWTLDISILGVGSFILTVLHCLLSILMVRVNLCPLHWKKIWTVVCPWSWKTY